MPKSTDMLTQEMAMLRALLAQQGERLEEAEGTLRAIRSGDVDAVIVNTPEGERVFTLQSADQAYQAIVEQMQEGAVMLVEGGHINYSNQRFADLVKAPLEKIIGANFREFVAATDVNAFRRLYASALTGAGRGELTLHAADGTSVPAQVGMSKLVLDGISSVCMVFADMTERKQAEQLRASEQHYRLLFDRNPDAVFVVDTSGRFRLVNPACELASGYSAAELLQKRLTDLCAPDQLAHTIMSFERGLSGTSPFDFETGLLRKDGRRVDVWIACEPAIVDGRVVALHCTGKDITERNRSEQLRDALNRVSDSLHSTLNEAEILRRVLAEGVNALGCETAAVSLRDRDGWIVSHLYGLPEHYRGLRLSDHEEQHALLALNSRQPVAVSDAFTDERFNREHLRRHNVRAVLVLPLIAHDEPLGAIYFVYHAAPHAFTEAEVSFGRQLAATTAVAMENALLLEQRKRAQELLQAQNANLEERIDERTKTIQLLYDISVVANEAHDIETTIDYCLRRASIDLGWSFAHALLPAADDPEVLVPAYVYYAQEPERFRKFREVTFGLRFRRGEGLSGRVLASGRPEWTHDVREELIQQKAAVAEELGLGFALAVPVPVGDKTAAVLEFFSDQMIQPTTRLTDVMLGIGMQLGRVFERAEFQERLLGIAEEVQQGIARDLHDDVGQELTGLGLKASTLADMLASTPTTAATPAGKLAADIAKTLDRTHEKARGLSRRMLPTELEQGLLADALEQLAAATADGSRIVCKVDFPHGDPGFDSRVSLHLYRIAQEAVANAVRHSGARNIRIRLHPDEGEIVLRIEDDGTGMSNDVASTDGMGRRTMRYRAGLIGGKLEFIPRPTGGTQVVCRLNLPCREKNIYTDSKAITSSWRKSRWLSKS